MAKLTKCKSYKSKRLPSTTTFDLLTPSFAAMEAPSQQFKQVFNLIDANGDGKISFYELRELLLCLGCHDKSKATILEAEDGFMDLDEFINILNDYNEEEDYLMDAFLVFDSDSDGLISAEELQKVLTSLGCDKCSLKECMRIIKGADKNGDGFVDFQEFCSMMTSNWKIQRS